MKLNKNNIASYLLTLQLVEAGYHITYDEIVEMYSAKSYLEKWNYCDEYTITVEQNKEWFKKASELFQKTLHCTAGYADKQVGWIDLHAGLRNKG